MTGPFGEEQLKGLIEHSLDAIALVEPNGTVSYVSPSIVRVLGYTPEEFAGLDAFEPVHPEEREAARRRFAELAHQPGGSQTAVSRVRHKDGSWRWIETVSTNQLDNPSVRAIVANFRDVTGRLQTEAALRDREEHFRLIVESATDFAIFTLTLDGHILSWNSGAERILGYAEDEILGQHVSIIFTPEDNAQGRVEFEMRGAFYEGRETDTRWHLKKGGIRFWANGMMMPLKDEDGTVKGYLKILRDRTEQKLARDALEQRTAELEEANRRKDEFLAMLAHELRNPLGAISNAVQISLRPAEEQDLEWSRRVIERQAKHLGRLLDDLLDVARITSGKIQLRKERLDLGPVIGRAVEAVRPLFESKKHEMSLSVAPGEMSLYADATRLEQVLVNVLINAAKYTPEGGHVTLSAQPEDGKVVVRVKDTGAGIPRRSLPHIFDLFAQADRTIDRSQGGLGVGLTIVQRLIEMHGGEVTAASDGPGKGSEFTIVLPAAEATTKVDAAPSSTPTGQTPADLHVLVVDDNQDSAAGLTKLLRNAGYRVTTAHDGPAALEAARDERPDVVLMDIGLPGMDGYEVTKKLRKDESDEGPLIIAVSGYGQEQDVRRSREAGFDHHLVKPVDYEMLLSILARQGSDLPVAPGNPSDE